MKLLECLYYSFHHFNDSRVIVLVTLFQFLDIFWQTLWNFLKKIIDAIFDIEFFAVFEYFLSHQIEDINYFNIETEEQRIC